MKNFPRAVLLLAALCAPAAALEPELTRFTEGMPACWPVYADPAVLVPTLKDQRGRVDERMSKVLRWGPLKAARALRKLELHMTKAACPGYFDLSGVRANYVALAASATALAQQDARAFASRNVSWTATWEEVRLSVLEKEMADVALKPGPFAGTCRPPEVSTEVYVPAAGQATGPEEEKILGRLAEQAKALQASQRDVTADFAELLEALEGRGCAELTRLFHSMVLGQRWAYFEHRDRELGELMRARLRWEPLPAP